MMSVGIRELRSFRTDAEVASSLLGRTELLRAVRRHPEKKAIDRAEDLIPIDVLQCTEAGRIPPVKLRSLDALHVVSALRLLRAGLHSVVTYDERIAEAARLHGLPVATPGTGR